MAKKSRTRRFGAGNKDGQRIWSNFRRAHDAPCFIIAIASVMFEPNIRERDGGVVIIDVIPHAFYDTTSSDANDTAEFVKTRVLPSPGARHG